VLTKRVIACLDVRGGRVVKGVQFVDIIDAGDPAELAHRHAAAGADEIVLLDITATHEGRGTLIETVKRTAATLFVPFTVGGGIRSAEDAEAVFAAGADKVSINSAAIARPELIGEIGGSFGAQAVIVAIDARRGTARGVQPRSSTHRGEATMNGAPAPAENEVPALRPVEEAEVYVSGGRKPTGLRVIDWAREAEARGAGEILLTSMDTDGMRGGFDCELTAVVSRAVQIPVIASGGAGSAAHFVAVFREGRADAALAASIFHFGVTDSRVLKGELQAAGVSVRLPC
jgi:cyclase